MKFPVFSMILKSYIVVILYNMVHTYLFITTLIVMQVYSQGQDSSGVPLQGEVLRHTLRYDYARVLDLSLLFYEAQRSGRLPVDNRIPWRHDSCLQCIGPRGANLQGGYYTNGRSLKFTFPNAAATTVLAWGLILRRDTYSRKGLLKRTEEAVKWGADYLVECNSGDEIVALVGDVTKLGAWLRPEDNNNVSIPYVSITKFKPGSDLSGEMAAALAACSIALKTSHPIESALYLKHAKQLFNFADSYPDNYSRNVEEVKLYYESWYGYQDELVWAALWLYLATNNAFYLQYAEEKYKIFKVAKRYLDEFSWADKAIGAKVLLYSITKKNEYLNGAKEFCANENKIYARKKTWGNLRYTANAAFLCLELGEMIMKTKSQENPYIEAVVKQIHYILGDTGRSFVVGFGYRWPKFIDHVGSSCPPLPHPCGIAYRDSVDENPNILYGALVGGPDQNHNYRDERKNVQQNGIGLDHNAGFQSVLATLLYLHHSNRLPEAAYTCKNNFVYSQRLQSLKPLTGIITHVNSSSFRLRFLNAYNHFMLILVFAML